MRSFRERFAFPLSGGKNRSSVGADTGNGAVRMLRLSALSGQALRLVGYTEAALPEAVIINGRIQNYETLSQILDRSLRSLYSGKAGNPPRKIPPAALAAALPHHQTQLGWLMPLSDGLSDQDRLNGELTRRFPHAETVGSLIRPSENRPLLFTAAERADAEALTEAYEGASLSLSILGTEWTAYADAFLYWQSQQAEAAENPAETCTLIVLNAAEMLGIVLQQGQIAYTQALPLSATAPNAAAYPLQINNTFSTQTAQEICRFLQFYRTSAAFPAQDSSAEPARIFLMGRAAQQADLPQAVEQECNIAAEYICPPLLLRPSENAASAGFPEYSDQPNKEWTERAADFNLAFGLALQQLYPTAHRVNLLPDSTKNTVSPVRKQMAAAVLFGSLTAAIAAFALDYAASQQAQRNALLQNALAELDTQYQQSAALRAEKAALLQQQKLLSGVAEQRIQTALFWQTLNTAMPSETVLTELAPDNGGYRLLGAAADEETAAQTLRALNAADWAFTAELLLQKRNAENGAQHFTILLRPNAAEAGQQNKTEAEQ